MERYSACPERNLRTFWGLHKSTVQTSWGLFKALCWLGFQGLLHPRKRELCQARTVWSCFHQTQPHLVLHIFDFPDWSFLGCSSGKKKNLPANTGDVRDTDSIPGSGRSPGDGHGTPLQYSCLENPMDRGRWQRVRHDWSNLARTHNIPDFV